MYDVIEPLKIIRKAFHHSSDEAKPRWYFEADKPRTTTAAIEEKGPRLSPEERAARVEFIRSLNK
jgi:hypothetical protein